MESLTLCRCPDVSFRWTEATALGGRKADVFRASSDSVTPAA